MKHRIGDPVTVRRGARHPLVLEFQYHGTVARESPLGYWITTGNAFTAGQLTEFGPFLAEELRPGWSEDA